MSERKAVSYVNRGNKPKNGEYVSHIPRAIAERLRKYCKLTNQNCQRYVERCIIANLDIDERKILESMNKDELIDMILKNEA